MNDINIISYLFALFRLKDDFEHIELEKLNHLILMICVYEMMDINITNQINLQKQ